MCNLSLCTVALGFSSPTQCKFLNLFDLRGTVGSAQSTTVQTLNSTASFVNLPDFIVDCINIFNKCLAPYFLLSRKRLIKTLSSSENAIFVTTH